ncbi:alkyl sulfatase dimerization domain-containing protein [Scopulibacillus cellulosilyticus]|uniref:Alkyl sulfatase dimerization domain-containing protein n=1 Tax=Scopulibacillus cellulosilyticus TaxID=2665665 RepID=A0ABW2Q4Y7_9BACL
MSSSRSLKRLPLDRQMDDIVENSIEKIELVSLKNGHYYVSNFANVGVIMTTDGIVVIDTTLNKQHAKAIYNAIRQKSKLPIRYIIYTHGHLDHVNSTEVFKETNTQIIGHENIADRFYKYRKLNDYHLRINSVQFQGKLGLESFHFITPDITFSKEYKFKLGDKTIYLMHGKGETDDHCFVHVPEDNIVYSGDFFINAFPNIGNPLKVNRFEREWYETCQQIQELKPDVLVPGHGRALCSKQDIQDGLQAIIDVLRFVHEKVIDCLNKGMTLEMMLEEIELPSDLTNNKYIQPSYGCLEFAIKGTYRRYTGWFDGNPTNLQPCKQKDVANEILSLMKDANIILKRCRDLMDKGEYQMVLHLTDILIFSQDNIEAKELKKEAVRKCSETNSNFIIRNIYDQLYYKMGMI